MPVDSFFYLLLLTGFCAGLMDAAVGGVTSIAFGVLALAWPDITVLVLAVATTWLPAQFDRRPMMDRLRQPV